MFLVCKFIESCYTFIHGCTHLVCVIHIDAFDLPFSFNAVGVSGVLLKCVINYFSCHCC